MMTGGVRLRCGSSAEVRGARTERWELALLEGPGVALMEFKHKVGALETISNVYDVDRVIDSMEEYSNTILTPIVELITVCLSSVPSLMKRREKLEPMGSDGLPGSLQHET